MFETTVNTPFSTVVFGNLSAPTDAQLFLNGAVSPIVPVFTSLGGGAWSVTFTPTATGIYSLFVYGSIQVRVQCVTKSLYSMLANVEDEALGSWQWNKETGVLTILRQNGSVLATHNVVDNLTEASRERVS